MSLISRQVVDDPARRAESTFGTMMAINGTVHGIGIIVLALRIYARTVTVKAFGIDDALMLLAWLFLFGGGMVPQIIAGTHGALGRHSDTSTRQELEMYGMMSFVQAMLMTVTSICLLKFSVASSLLRLNSTKWYKRILWGLIVFVFCYMIIGWVSLLAYCNPVRAHWDKEAFKTAKCYPRKTVDMFAALNTALNISTDVAFATIPIPMLWKLQVKLRTRLYLIGIFNLAYITVIIGIVKIVFQQTIRGRPDKTYHNWIQFFGLLQQNVGLIAASAPMLKPLFGKTLDIQSSYAAASAKKSYGSRSRPEASGYLRKDDLDFEMTALQDKRGTDATTFHTTTIKGGNRTSDDGSEDFILPSEHGPRQSQVVKTTETTVTYSKT